MELDTEHPLLRFFRQELRRRRGELSQEALARKLGYSQDTVSLVEVGRQRPTLKFARACDRELSSDRIFENLVREAGIDGDEEWFHGWIDAEKRASSLWGYECLLVPGLVQIAPYAHAVNSKWQTVDSTRNPDADVKERMERQSILTAEHPPNYVAVIDESVLYRPVGSAEIMRAQLQHLLDVSERPRVAIQILPRSLGEHVGLGGAFLLASFPDDIPDMLYLENVTGRGEITRNPDTIRHVSGIYDALRTDAYSAKESRDAIYRAMEGEYGQQ